MPVNISTNNSIKPRFFNRELSWLAFNERVLDQAFSEKYPLLERTRFLSFVSSNLDQFYEIRVAGLMQKVDAGITRPSLDGSQPKELLEEVRNRAHAMSQREYSCWRDVLKPALATEKVFFKEIDELTKAEFSWLRAYFRREVFPVLTPLAVDPTHPFPLILNKSLNLFVSLRNLRKKQAKPLKAVVQVPRILPRLVRIEAEGSTDTFVFLSDVVRHFVSDLFPGHEALGAWAFRITRNSHLYVDEEEVENLLLSIEDELHNRRRGAAVRLEIDDSIDKDVLDYLLKSLNLSEKDVLKINGPINLYRLMKLVDLVDRDDLKFSPFEAFVPQQLAIRENLFDQISNNDHLLHHPYDSFSPMVEFLRQAAIDPEVFAIKLTIYRTSGDSPIVKALMDAAQNGKQVTAMVELKARFDEEANVQWSRKMEEVGVHVVYGLAGLKTHCKCCLVVRREGKKLKRYAHLGTGNYNPSTAKTYTDYSLFTAKAAFTADMANLFNTLTGYTRKPVFKKLLVAPFNLHESMIRKIQHESKMASSGKEARIIIKVNSLIDPEIIQSLYEASQAGVKVDLIVRGICGLVPGVKGLSENIKVRSLLGRFLEHSRVYYFKNSPVGESTYLGSPDWMPRNFFRRVEVVFPVEEKIMQEGILQTMENILSDNSMASELRQNGNYVPAPKRRRKEFSVQDHLITLSQEKQALTLEKVRSGRAPGESENQSKTNQEQA
ncbi:MAG: polyphosphate kinase 1 [Verrucomicrobia bacterium]|nr:polyphosphate kinase 1 [Verrucomicrobiota bacterium]